MDLVVDLVDALGAGAQGEGEPTRTVVFAVAESVVADMDIGDGVVYPRFTRAIL